MPPPSPPTHPRKPHLLLLIQRPVEPQQRGRIATVAERTAARRLRMMSMRAGGVSAASAGQAEASVSAVLSKAVNVRDSGHFTPAGSPHTA
jgi:hypothetical protein